MRLGLALAVMLMSAGPVASSRAGQTSLWHRPARLHVLPRADREVWSRRRLSS